MNIINKINRIKTAEGYLSDAIDCLNNIDNKFLWEKEKQKWIKKSKQFIKKAFNQVKNI